MIKCSKRKTNSESKLKNQETQIKHNKDNLSIKPQTSIYVSIVFPSTQSVTFIRAYLCIGIDIFFNALTLDLFYIDSFAYPNVLRIFSNTFLFKHTKTTNIKHYF